MPGKLIVWPEPSLLFTRGQRQRITNPKDGLLTFHPLDYNLGQRNFDTVRISILCQEGDFDDAKGLLDQLKNKHSPTTRTSAYPYTGFSEIYKVDLDIPRERSEAIRITQDEMNKVLNTPEVGSFTQEYESLMARKFQDFLDKAAGRDGVLYVVIPPSLENKFATFNIIGYGLRELTKVMGVRKSVRTQVLTQGAFKPFDRADHMWNLSLATYVQAGGRPWRIKEIPQASLFMGIAYGIRKGYGGQTIAIGLAEVFNTYGEYVDIAALDFEEKDFIIDPITENLYLNYDSMKSLVAKAMKYYGEKYAEGAPLTVVIHKTTDFKDHEIRAARDAVGSSAMLDLVHIVTNVMPRILGESQATSRGSFYQDKSEPNTGLLYTTGYVSEEGTYPGIGSPAPLELRRDYGNTELPILGMQAFSLTKMDWNTTKIMLREPVTIKFARKVSDVIKAGLTAEQLVRDFRYYM